MNNKLNGFTYIECIVSLSIMITAVSLIYTTLYGSLELTNKSSRYKEMINVAKKTLDDSKYAVLSNTEETALDTHQLYEDNVYAVHTKIEKIKDYYECYKIDVKVVKDNIDIELSSYVTQ